MPITPDPRPGSSSVVVVDVVAPVAAAVVDVVVVEVCGADGTVDGGCAVVVVSAGEPEHAARTTPTANAARNALITPPPCPWKVMLTRRLGESSRGDSPPIDTR
jgi:hypothetical protein